MSDEKSLKTSSAPGLSQVRSVTDIPTALTEAEAECSALLKELGYVAKANPALQPVFEVWQDRHGVILNRLAVCRRILLASVQAEQVIK